MKIVIELDEILYGEFLTYGIVGLNVDNQIEISKAIRNGTPLPEHHGDLIDKNDFIKNLRDSKKGFWRKKFFINGESTMESMAYEINDIKKILNDAPTIIEGSDPE